MATKEKLDREALKLTVKRAEDGDWSVYNVDGEEVDCAYDTREEALEAARSMYEDLVAEEMERLEEERQEREEAEREELLERIGECDLETLRKMAALLK